MADTSEPAFPTPMVDPLYYGMSVRDWFAGQALVAMGTWEPAPYNHMHDARMRVKAAYAYEVADAMLAERNK